MIITRIMPAAGMGNQMFMYAAGLSISSRLGTELRLGTADFDIGTRIDRPYVLDCFPKITEKQASFSETFRICPKMAFKDFKSGKNMLWRLKYGTAAKFLHHKGLYFPKWCSWSPEFENVPDNTYIMGYWESERIFRDIAGLVRRKFAFSQECFNPELSEKVKSCNSIAIHVRRGDKVSGSSRLYASDEHYIRLAIEKLSSLTQNPSFFVFSDDIDWCKHNLPNILNAEYTFIEGQTPAQDMALMTLCKHVIVGVSTFSWWGAWLNENPDKIVIAPDINFWFRPDTFSYDDRKYLLPESWIKIH